MRQAHYAAGDQVNQAQGRLYEASAEVGRLEAESAMWSKAASACSSGWQLQGAELRSGQQRRTMRPPNWSSWPGHERGRGEVGRCWPPRARSRPASCPAGRRLRRRSRRRPTSSAPAWRRCSSRSRCWPPSSAASKSKPPAAAAPKTLAATATRWHFPMRPGWRSARQQLEAAEAAELAEARLHELQEQVPQLDEERRERQQAVNQESATPGRPVGPAGGAARRCRTRCGPTASSSPGWPSTGWTACKACGAACTSSLAGKTRWSRAARAPGRAGSVPPGHGAGLCRNDAPPAKLAFYSPPRVRPPPRRGPAGFAAEATGRLAAA
jgi:chromosome segregation protein